MTGLALQPVDRLLLQDQQGPGLTEHLQAHGPLPALDPVRLLAEVDASGLTGRGGAGFPLARKLRAVAGARGAVVVANGSEGEPASGKDRALLTRAPHLVLDGLQVAAQAVGAARAVLAVAEAEAVAAVRAALRERDDALSAELAVVPARFLTGQETALVRVVDGGPALPRTPAPRVTERGVGRRPTLVSNVETLAHLALVARNGAAWFRSVGTADEPGTVLCTVDGVVVEVPLGTRLTEVLDRAGAGGRPLGGLLVGGYHGTWLTPSVVADARLSRAGLAPYGASPGAGVLLPLATGTCPLAATSSVVRWLAGQSARQCGPCLNGLPALADAVEQLAGTHWSPDAHQRVAQLVGLVEGRGACHHPDGTARMVRSALVAFADELQAHRTGTCLATSRPGPRRTP